MNTALLTADMFPLCTKILPLTDEEHSHIHEKIYYILYADYHPQTIWPLCNATRYKLSFANSFATIPVSLNYKVSTFYASNLIHIFLSEPRSKGSIQFLGPVNVS